MKKIILLVAIYVCLASLFAGNSIFSYDGYPVRFYGLDAYSMGMGDTGASDVFRLNNGFANPAMGNSANYSLLSTGIIMGYTQYKSDIEPQGEVSFTDNSLDLPYFSLSFPYHRHRFGFQFNSFASGLVKNQTSFADSTLGTITEQQEMDRYLYKADLIYSYHLNSLRLGASLNYYLGHETRSFIQNSGSGLFDTREQLVTDYKNPGFSLGAIYQWPKLALGGHASLPLTLKGETKRSTIHQIDDPVDAEYEMPAMINASVTALPLKHFKVAADISYEDWSEIGADYNTSYKLGLGAAYEPAREEYETGLGRLPYRAGISYRKLPFKDSYGEDINEWNLSAGLSFNLAREANRIDVALQYTSRGNLDTNKMTDRSYMLIFGLTGFDIFSKAPNRKAPREIPEAEDLSEW